MLTRITLGIGVLLFLLAGCATQSEQDVADPKKAADLNADLGVSYMMQGQYELALSKLEKALEYDSRLVKAHHYIAELYRRVGEPVKAEKHYTTALDLTPNDAALRNNYGVFLCSQKRYGESERELLKVLENPVYSARQQTYENLGLCLQEKGDLAKAEQYYREALKLNPKLPKTLLALAELSLGQSNHTSARAFLQRYEALAPQTPRSLWLGIRIERTLGDRNAVASYGMALKNQFPEAEETRLYLESEQR